MYTLRLLIWLATAISVRWLWRRWCRKTATSSPVWLASNSWSASGVRTVVSSSRSSWSTLTAVVVTSWSVSALSRIRIFRHRFWRIPSIGSLDFRFGCWRLLWEGSRGVTQVGSCIIWHDIWPLTSRNFVIFVCGIYLACPRSLIHHTWTFLSKLPWHKAILQSKR